MKKINLSPDKPVSPLNKGRSHNSVVLVGGCFDILHLGHITFLKKAKNLGEKLVVLLESDQNIQKNKGNNRPINNQENRAKILESLRMVDQVVKLPEMKTDQDYLKIIKKIKPTIIAVTQNDHNLINKENQAKLVGAKLVEVTELIPHQSTSRIIEIITENP
ncbi:MAG: adenylyltransferase/cytidyltransferase family protein [Candidatus Shapirobacteria bacterium]|nr:adenylyltransferase/cytidyltransferase family protein [Candidatus Shapirobacteria bacterium]